MATDGHQFGNQHCKGEGGIKTSINDNSSCVISFCQDCSCQQ